jgi:hypothetical protein
LTPTPATITVRILLRVKGREVLCPTPQAALAEARAYERAGVAAVVVEVTTIERVLYVTQEGEK